LASLQRFQHAVGERSAGSLQSVLVHAHMGKRREALEALGEFEKGGKAAGHEFELAAIYSALGQRDRAMAELVSLVATRSCLSFVFVDSRLDSWRSAPRFQQLMRRVGLLS